MFSLSIVLLISRLWRQIGISYQTALKSGFDVWSGSFRFSWRAFFCWPSTGQAIVPCPVFSHFLRGGEKQNTNRKAQARVKQAAITGETPKINYTAPAANSPAFLCNQLHPQWAWTLKKGGMHRETTKHTQWLLHVGTKLNWKQATRLTLSGVVSEDLLGRMMLFTG